jgi:hypothetical protein
MPSLTRLTNNFVKNWFGQLKKLLLRLEKVYPSQIVSVSFPKLIDAYITYYQNGSTKKKEKDDEVNKKEKIIKEVWKPKPKGTKRKKCVYYENLTLMILLKWKNICIS